MPQTAAAPRPDDARANLHAFVRIVMPSKYELLCQRPLQTAAGNRPSYARVYLHKVSNKCPRLDKSAFRCARWQINLKSALTVTANTWMYGFTWMNRHSNEWFVVGDCLWRQSNISKCIQAATKPSNMLNWTHIHVCLLRERSQDRVWTVPYTCIAAA